MNKIYHNLNNIAMKMEFILEELEESHKDLETDLNFLELIKTQDELLKVLKSLG